MSQSGLTWTPPAASCAATTRTAKPAPTLSSPNENLTGVEGSREPSAIQSHAKTGASIQMNIEFIDWNQLLGKFHPKTDVRVSRSAKRLSVEPACSKSDQKSAAARKKRPMTYSRLRSSGVQPPDRKSQAKKTTVMMRSM